MWSSGSIPFRVESLRGLKVRSSISASRADNPGSNPGRSTSILPFRLEKDTVVTADIFVKPPNPKNYSWSLPINPCAGSLRFVTDEETDFFEVIQPFDFQLCVPFANSEFSILAPEIYSATRHAIVNTVSVLAAPTGPENSNALFSSLSDSYK